MVKRITFQLFAELTWKKTSLLVEAKVAYISRANLVAVLGIWKHSCSGYFASIRDELTHKEKNFEMWKYVILKTLE